MRVQKAFQKREVEFRQFRQRNVMHRLRKTIHNSKDDCVTLRVWETSDEVQGYVRPGSEQAKRHYQIFVVPNGCIKGRLPLISLPYAHQVISIAEVQFGEDGGSLQVFKS